MIHTTAIILLGFIALYQYLKIKTIEERLDKWDSYGRTDDELN